MIDESNENLTTLIRSAIDQFEALLISNSILKYGGKIISINQNLDSFWGVWAVVNKSHIKYIDIDILNKK